MNTPENSPLPWRTNRHGDLLDSEGKIIYLDGTDKEIANARLIIRAVNSHAQLLAAAKWAATVIENGTHGFGCVEALRAAITAAEELVL